MYGDDDDDAATTNTHRHTHTHMFDYIDHILHNHISGRGSTYMLKVILMSYWCMPSKNLYFLLFSHLRYALLFHLTWTWFSEDRLDVHIPSFFAKHCRLLLANSRSFFFVVLPLLRAPNTCHFHCTTSWSHSPCLFLFFFRCNNNIIIMMAKTYS